MAEEGDEALEISSNEESGTDRDDTKESMDQSTSESIQSGSPTVISLLNRLRSPTPADLSRKRYLRQNPPPKGVKTDKGKEKGDPFVVVLRYLTDDWELKQCVGRLKHDREDIAQQIIVILSTKVGISSNLIVAATYA